MVGFHLCQDKTTCTMLSAFQDGPKQNYSDLTPLGDRLYPSAIGEETEGERIYIQ